MTYFKWKIAIGGGHTHVALYAGSGPGNLAKAGTFVLRNEEWVEFERQCVKPHRNHSVEELPR